MAPSTCSSSSPSGESFSPVSSWPSLSAPDSFDGDGHLDVAIVGFSFEFPGADSVESFWNLMTEGRCVASEFPRNRLESARYRGGDESRKGTIRPGKAAFIDRDISAFDAKLFGMTHEEACGTDPQQRILLETAYRALENAGIPLDKINGSNTSVHTGCFTADYLLAAAKDPDNSPRYAASGMAGCMLSNRLSTFFNLYGPSITVDTACSSSLVALDMACKCLRQGDSSMGIVAGCNLLLTPDYFVSLSSLGVLSPDGVSHSFDSRANGYGRGEGFGVLIIKPLDAALADGDTIRAVIRATGTNQNGHTPLAVPSKEMQARLIQDTYRRAGLDMAQTRFFEAHGTGTPAGDPLEAMAIGHCFGPGRDAGDPIVVGALKANVGHLEGAAGIAGVIKTILVLEAGVIPPIANLSHLNSNIDAEFLKLQFPRAAQPWPSTGLRRASVSSFGFGGTNAHVILDDAMHYLESRQLYGHHCTSIAPTAHTRLPPALLDESFLKPPSRHPRLFVWSAHGQNNAVELIKLYRDRLLHESELYRIADADLDALAYTLSQRRSLHAWRTFAVADSLPHLLAQLETPQSPSQTRPSPSIGFIFTGQGAQWPRMGRELFAYPAFRDSVYEADQFLRSRGCEWKAADVLLTGDEDVTGQARISQPRFAQTLCTILQIALVELLRTIRVYPATVVGHSSGEIAAAYAVGAICKRSAWKLAYFRGLLSSQLAERTDGDAPRGSMMAVGLSESSVSRYVDEVLGSQGGAGVLTIACVNSPKNTTLSGDQDLILATKSLLDRDGVFARVLKVPVAYHSPHMLVIAQSYQQSIGILEPGESPPHYASMISSVTGESIPMSELRKPEYWVQNMVSPVRFAESIGRLCQNSVGEVRIKLDLSHRNLARVSDLLEIGPHSTLQGPIRETMEVVSSSSSSKINISYMAALVRNRSAASTLLEAVGKMHCLGFDIDLAKINNLSTGSPKRQLGALPFLPEYPYDHTRTYWDEPRVSKNMRLLPQPYNEFLGRQVPDWNPLEPRWRNTLKTASMPWMQDHKVGGEILFPAAGMFVMAIEAITQISAGKKIVGYEIRDTSILTALTIAQDDRGVEVQFQLRPCLDAYNKSDLSATFSLFAIRGDDGFAEICHGSIKAIFAIQGQGRRLDEPDNAASNPQSNHVRNLIDSAKASYESEVHTTELYETLSGSGYQYGPIFQGIEHARRNNRGQAVADVLIKRPPPTPGTSGPSVVHPCTLDTILQLTLPAIVRGDSNDVSMTWVPTYLAKMWVSGSGFESCPSDRIHVHSSTEPRGARLRVSTIQAATLLNLDGAKHIIQAEGVELSAVGDPLRPLADDGTISRTDVQRLCYDMVYKPDLRLLDNAQTAVYASEGSPSSSAEDTHFLRTVKEYIHACMTRAMATVPADDVPPHMPHVRQQHAWMQRRLAERPASEHAADEAYAALQGRLDATGRLGHIYVLFGCVVPAILRGEKHALAIMLKDDMLREYYDLFNTVVHFFAPLKRYLDALAHKSPGMRLLEVGAGTGATTRFIMDALVVETPNGPLARFASYDYTDVGPSFLEKAQEEWAAQSKMRFRLFDAEEDPVVQGYEEGSYDIIFAANVVHGTKSLRATLSNIRRLLREDGKLILVEITKPESIIGSFIFGFLPGWWQGTEPWRQDGPLATVSQWDQELRASGFTGIDQAFDDFPGSEENHFASLLISSAAPVSTLSHNPAITEQSGCDGRTVLLVTGWNEPRSSSSVAGLAKSKLQEELGIADVRLSCFAEAATLLQDENMADNLPLVVVIQDRGWLSLGNLSSPQYAMFNSTLAGSTGVLWLAVSPSGEENVSPIGMVEGFARALRAERHGLVFVTAAIDSASTSSVLSANIEKSLRNFIHGASGVAEYERELVQIGNELHIPRVYENNSLNRQVHEATRLDLVEREQRFGEQNLTLKVRQPGLLDTMYFEEVPEQADPLGPDDIEVSVKAVGVNFRDCLIALGRMDQDALGTECSGVVVATGSHCRRLLVGDRVLVSAVDTFRGLVRCPEKLAAKMPDSMSFADAGALPTNFVTAWHALVRVARLAPGESILIHSGAGGTGQAAIQIAQQCGAEIFTTVGSASKKRLLTELYGIPPERILHSRDLSFADDIKRLTDGVGVDVVLNSLSGDALVASWECVAPYGRFLEIGKRDIFGRSKLPMFQFARNVSFCAVDLGTMTLERPKLIEEALRELVDLFAKGELRMPEPRKTFALSEVEEAFHYLQSGKNAGKVVLELDADSLVSAFVAPKPVQCAFGADDTFVIAGGLGAQGRVIAQWMVDRGARNLVLLGRSGTAGSSKAADVVNHLRSRGVNIYCSPCNIADKASIAAVMEHCRAYMPPIKGCIHAAMDLQDSIFDNMSYAAWSACLQPKVHGSWNLHQQLPTDLDFFVMLSSVAGVIGSQGQSNYAAGNTFQDALARHRLARGQRAVSLNFSMMGGDGFAVERADAAMQFIKTRHVSEMTQPEILAVLEHACHKSPPQDGERAQIVMGLLVPADIIARGLDPSGWINEPTFANLHQVSAAQSPAHGSDGGGAKQGKDLGSIVAGAASRAEAADEIADALAVKLCRTLSLARETFDLAQPLHVHGVDSLIAVELRNWFLQNLKVDVAVFEILSGVTSAALGRIVAEKVSGANWK